MIKRKDLGKMPTPRQSQQSHSGADSSLLSAALLLQLLPLSLPSQVHTFIRAGLFQTHSFLMPHNAHFQNIHHGFSGQQPNLMPNMSMRQNSVASGEAVVVVGIGLGWDCGIDSSGPAD